MTRESSDSIPSSRWRPRDGHLAGEGQLEDVAVVQPPRRFGDGAGVAPADGDAGDQERVGGDAEGEDLAVGRLADRDAQPFERPADRRMIGRVQRPAPRRGDQGPGESRDAPGDFR